MVKILGKSPERWWSKWKNSGQYFDEALKWIGDDPHTVSLFEELVDRKRLDAVHCEQLEELLTRMLRYEPDEKVTAEDVEKIESFHWGDSPMIS